MNATAEIESTPTASPRAVRFVNSVDLQHQLAVMRQRQLDLAMAGHHRASAFYAQQAHKLRQALGIDR